MSSVMCAFSTSESHNAEPDCSGYTTFPGVDCRPHLTKGAAEIYLCRYSGHLCINSDARVKP